jgi:hypothetical protein
MFFSSGKFVFKPAVLVLRGFRRFLQLHLLQTYILQGINRQGCGEVQRWMLAVAQMITDFNDLLY